MTSIATRDDIEDALVRAGIRAPHLRSQVMRIIDFYVAGKLHGEIPPVPDTHFGMLLPGESDFEEQVTRCLKCGEVKRWVQFTMDKRRDTRHKDICKNCEYGDDGTIPADLFLTCHGPCGQRRHASEFYRDRRKKRKFGYKCKACLHGERLPEDVTYMCRRCRKSKPLDGFPPQKRSNPCGTFPCLECLDKSGDGVSRRWKCAKCEKVKGSHYFPQERQDNPRLRLNCISCGN